MVKTVGEVTERYSYTTKGRTVTFTDGKGSDCIYSYDEFDCLVSEKNRIDGLQNYTYNDNAELKSKRDFEGNMTAVSYDTRTRTRKSSFADGASSYFSTDKYGSVQVDYSYDAFGSPYLDNLENDIGFGYCGKVYDVGTGLYDYGFRDYSPVSARFTTIDPIRDGSNLFSYVVNDSVNYIDLWGLCASDSKSAKRNKNITNSENTKPDKDRTSKKGVDINLFPKDEDIYDYANKVKNPLNDDIFIVGGHGDAWDIVGPDKYSISPSDLADMIKSDKNYRDGITIVLYSCSTGNNEKAGDYTYAQKLADKLGAGAKVIAPSDTIWIYSNGTTKIYGDTPKTDKKGNPKTDKNSNIIYIIDTEKPGHWYTFTGSEK